MLTSLALSNYRSIRDVRVTLGRLNLVVGANGVGKSNLYRALRLLAGAASGQVVGMLAAEGGLRSALWAGGAQATGGLGRSGFGGGQRRGKPVRLRLGFASDSVGYALSLGLPPPDRTSAFSLDPIFKREALFVGPVARLSATIVERTGGTVRVRADAGGWVDQPVSVPPFESVLAGHVDPAVAPELVRIRERLRGWRFYDHFDTRVGCVARRAQVGTRTPVLAADGADLAAAIQTINEIGDPDRFQEQVADAFPGAVCAVEHDRGLFHLRMHQPGMRRALSAAEISEGTLRYLMLIAALLTPRPPELLVLNEPENSLHEDLLAPLARLIVRATEFSQLWVVTHSAILAECLGRAPACNRIALAKPASQTVVEGQDLLSVPQWEWPGG